MAIPRDLVGEMAGADAGVLFRVGETLFGIVGRDAEVA